MKKLFFALPLVVGMLFMAGCKEEEPVTISSDQHSSASKTTAFVPESLTTASSCTTDTYTTAYDVVVVCTSGTLYVTCSGGTPSSKTITSGRSQRFTRKAGKTSETIKISWPCSGYNGYYLTY